VKNARFAKYIAMLMLAFIGRNAMAQDAPAADSTQTKKVKVTDWKDVLSATLYLESQATNAGWTPIMTIVPGADLNIDFFNRFSVSASTHYCVTNWAESKSLMIFPFDMSVGGAVKTKAGDFGVEVGHLVENLGYCLQGYFSNTTPLFAVCYGAFHSGTGAFLPRTAQVKWNKNGHGLAIGYAEMDDEKPGFGFNGKDQALTASGETSIFKGMLRAKVMFVFGKSVTTSYAYINLKPVKNFEILLSGVIVPNEEGVTLGTRYTFPKNNNTGQAAGGLKNNGIKVVSTSRSFPFGGRAGLSVFTNDPRPQFTSTTTGSDKIYFGGEIGYTKTFKANSKRQK